MENYKNPYFDIKNITQYNNVTSSSANEEYLDFAINQTIRKQLPNITIEQEQYYAKIILNKFFQGDFKSFTSTYNIRNNIKEIGQERIFGCLVKAMIEHDAVAKEVHHALQPQNIMQQWASYITENTKMGYLGNITPELYQNIDVLIENYIDMKYRITEEQSTQYNNLANRNPSTEKALQQLNLELSLAKTEQQFPRR